MSTSVSVFNLTRRYSGTTYALRDVSLKVEAGEFVTLLGPSGSGKSTLLKILAGFEQPTSGDVQIGGRSVIDVPSHARNIGMVFQNYALFPHMTVAENIAFPLTVRGIGSEEIKRRVLDVLNVTHMSTYIDRYPRELSGGQQQRVALARAMIFDPKVMLMDEPLGALDRHLREQLKVEIKRIQRQYNMTVLFVTHDQDEALTMSDQVVVMRDGRVEQKATPHELYALPANRFIAEFIGESNIVPCTADRNEARWGGVKLPCANTSVQEGEGWLMIRPEFVDISSDRPAYEGSLKGVIQESIFLGEGTRHIVSVGDVSFKVKTTNRHRKTYQAGQDVFLSWPETEARFLER
ncbi:ABC transporter ATP-binding protein [Paraburkholderia sp. BR14263]|uniref:ABC transporter ATP-binding protein n=1 Tax=unclassified Paraburkholderia TaxID=2615204 RepID=UPI0034CE28E6